MIDRLKCLSELIWTCNAYHPADVSDGGREDSAGHYSGLVHLLWSTATDRCRWILLPAGGDRVTLRSMLKKPCMTSNVTFSRLLHSPYNGWHEAKPSNIYSFHFSWIDSFNTKEHPGKNALVGHILAVLYSSAEVLSWPSDSGRRS